jgi:hypothetical protein
MAVRSRDRVIFTWRSGWESRVYSYTPKKAKFSGSLNRGLERRIILRGIVSCGGERN